MPVTRGRQFSRPGEHVQKAETYDRSSGRRSVRRPLRLSRVRRRGPEAAVAAVGVVVAAAGPGRSHPQERSYRPGTPLVAAVVEADRAASPERMFRPDRFAWQGAEALSRKLKARPSPRAET
jgi:hypothetical protein